MSEQSATPESGALTVEQAIAALAPEPVEDTAPDAPLEAAEEPKEDTEGATSAPEEPVEGAETPADPEQQAEAEPEAVAPAEPPRYWSQEAKARFAELPPELQAVVLQQEGPREAASAKAKAEAAEIRQQAEAEMGKVQQLASALAERLPEWVQSFQSRWGTQTPDWAAYAQTYGTDAAFAAKNQFESEQRQLAEAAQAKTLAERQAHEAYVKAEFAKLAEIAPELTHPETGAAKRAEITSYLSKQGIPPEALQKISAVEMSIVHKAMLYDGIEAKLKAAPPPKPAAPAAKSATVRPAAATARVPENVRVADTAKRRFVQTKSIDDAIAYLNAKG